MVGLSQIWVNKGNGTEWILTTPNRSVITIQLMCVCVCYCTILCVHLVLFSLDMFHFSVKCLKYVHSCDCVGEK